MTIRIPKPILAVLLVALVACAFLGGAAVSKAGSPDPKTYAHDFQHLYLYWGQSSNEDDLEVVHVHMDGKTYRCSVLVHQDGYGGKVSHDCDWDHPVR